MRVVGIDTSLTSTGLGAITIHPNGVIRADTRTVTSSPPKRKKTDPPVPLVQRHQRLKGIARQVEGFLFAGPIDLAVVEAPAYASTSGQAHERAGLWWRVVDILLDNGILVATAAPTQRAQYATGKGGAPKEEVLVAMVKRHPTWEITGNDIADGVALAAMGCRYLGHPVDEVSAACLKAMEKVMWPVAPAA